MNCKERVLEFKSIRKAFPGGLALDDVSFNISRGEVHGLVGENGAGKSTLIKILCGVYQADGGTILIDGKDACIKQPLDAQQAGIQVMHQEINVVPDMTVAENIWLYNLPRKGILVNDKELNRKTRELLETLALTHIDPKMRMGELSLADQQMTNLARIVSTKPKVILMDEPTATLTMNEANKLFKVIRKFRDMGVSIIYISHYIDEVLEICDRITVLRDGHFIDTVSSAGSSSEEIIAHMVGKKLKTKRRTSEALGEEVLRVSQISTANIIKFINLNLHKKEVLGLYGLNGAGKTETLRAIAGLDPLLTGSMELFGEDISKTNHNTRMSRGIVYAPEDRRRLGLVMPMSVAQNSSLGNEDKYTVGPMISGRKEREDVCKYVSTMHVATPSIQTSVNVLSGGNQQKVILARCLARRSKIFLMDEPTVGIDVGARAEIYELISNIIKGDAAVIIASSDMDEILEVSDRVAIIANGRIVKIMEHDEFDREKMLYYAMGDEKQ